MIGRALGIAAIQALVIAINANAQNNVTVHSIDTETGLNSKGQVVAINLANGQRRIVPIDTTTGNAIVNIPNGTYQIDVEDSSYYRHRDTLNIHADTTLPRWMIKDYPTGLDLDFLTIGRRLSATRGPPLDNTTLLRNRWLNAQNIPIYNRGGVPANSQANYNAAKANLASSSTGLASITEATDSSDVGITAYYVPQNQVPGGGLAYTDVHSYYPDGSIKHVKIWFANNITGGITSGIFLREIGRALTLFPEQIPYTNFVMYANGPLININAYHPVEAKWIEIQFKLPFKNDMSKYKERVDVLTGVKETLEDVLASEFKLEQNYPNPFNPETTITYSHPSVTNISITVYNTLGQRIRTLVDEREEPGTYRITFNGEGLASGVYYVRLTAVGSSAAQSVTITRSMVLIK